MRVLFVDDDDAFASLLIAQLGTQNYVVDRVSDGEAGWAYAATFEYDLIVLDWMLPQLSGIGLCERLRAQGDDTPILLLTAKDERTDKIKGLEAGADDYVVKPCDIEELLVRIRVLLRRSPADSAPIFSWGDLSLDSASCEVTYGGQPVALTAKEYSLLELFLRHSKQVFNAKALLDRTWSSEEFPSESTVRSHIRGLRQKLKLVGAPTDFIETVHGLGYRLKSQTAASPQKAVSSQRDRQTRYLEGLTQAWDAHKGESIARWKKLMHIAQTLKTRGLNEQQQSQARQLVHALAGTLGTFGLLEGYRLSLQLEALFQVKTALLPAQADQVYALATMLGHTLDDAPKLIDPVEETAQIAAIVMVDVNHMPYMQQLMALAVGQGFGTQIAASVETAAAMLSLGTPAGKPHNLELAATLPDLVVVNFVAGEADPVLDESISQMLLQFVATLTAHWPHLPVLVITPQADFGNRLDLIRRGGAMVLEYPVVPSEVLQVIAQAMSYRASKIMIVDDDAHYLQQVIELLHPWDLQITPLTNPQRFWTLFNQVLPDLVILDIEMPSINGFELCQVLRSHPQWQHLPIIFLSVHSDPAKQNQAFALGADDYITKPIQARDLASRLLNRLRRYQAQLRWQQAAS